MRKISGQNVIDLTKLKPRTQQSVAIADSAFILADDYVSSIRDIWDGFDRIICIHYLPYTERFENIKRELKRVGILDLPQFEWYFTIDNDFYRYVLDGIPNDKIDSSRMSLSNIKYTIDSYSLLKKLQFSGYEHVLILEDDIAFHRNLDFIQEVVKSTPEDYDVMNYDPEILWNGNSLELFKVNKYMFKYHTGKIINMSCSALSKKAISHIIDRQKEILRPFDIYTWIDIGKLNCYCTLGNKNIAVQTCEFYSNRQTDKKISQKYCPIDIGNYNFPNGYGQHDKYDVIVSFATYAPRFQGSNDIYRFLESILNQDCNVKYHIVMTAYWKDINKLGKLRDYLEKNGIEIIVSERNFKSHCKYLFSMQRYSDVPVITVDDDMVYSKNMVQRLYDDWVKHPRTVVCGRAKKIKYRSDGTYDKYDSWKLVDFTHPEKKDVFPTGCGAVLYPPEFCQCIDYSLTKKIVMDGATEVTANDDIILHRIAIEHEIPSKVVDGAAFNSTVGELVVRELKTSNSDTALWRVNVLQGMNDKQMHILDCKFDANYNIDVVVSLTSYPHRFRHNDFIRCLRSVSSLQKTKYAFKVVLNLYKDDINLLPDNVKKFIDNNGIEIIPYDVDIKQHKKYLLPMMKYGRNVPVITVDDDSVYTNNLVQCMMDTYLQNPDTIVCGRCNRIQFYENTHMPLPTKIWCDCDGVDVPGLKGMDLFGVGVGGILYPPRFCQEIDDRFIELSNIIRSDDVLLYLVSNIINMPHMVANTTNRYCKFGGIGFFGYTALEYYKDDLAMFKLNNAKNYKDESLKLIGKFKSVDELAKYCKEIHIHKLIGT